MFIVRLLESKYVCNCERARWVSSARDVWRQLAQTWQLCKRQNAAASRIDPLRCYQNRHTATSRMNGAVLWMGSTFGGWAKHPGPYASTSPCHPPPASVLASCAFCCFSDCFHDSRGISGWSKTYSVQE